MPKTSSVVLVGRTISITRDPIGSNVSDIIDKLNVVGVSGVYNKKPNNGELTHGTVTGNYVIGETITGGTSGATATIAGFKNATTFNLSFISTALAFVAGETLTGGTSAATSTASAVITPTTYSGEWKYPYSEMTILQINMNDGSSVSIELHEVSNQPTWSTGTLAGLQAAEADINAFL